MTEIEVKIILYGSELGPLHTRYGYVAWCSSATHNSGYRRYL